MTPELWMLSALLFLPVAAISFIALRRAWEPQERINERLARSGYDLLPESSSELLFEGLTTPLAGLLPTSAGGRAAIYQELRAAGYYRSSALTEYLALRNLLFWVPLLIAGMLALTLEVEDIPLIAVTGIVLAVLGFSLPRIYIQVRGRNRARQIERALPTGVDLLVLALTAGLNLYAALQRVAAELRSSFPALAEEFDITRRQAELRSLEHALDQLADRVRLPEVRNLAIILAQSERLGSDATTILLETSNSLRTTLRQRAETQANRTSFWLLFPTVACFLVAAGIILVGPVFLEFSRQMNQNRDLLQQGQKSIGKIRMPVNPLRAPPTPPQIPSP